MPRTRKSLGFLLVLAAVAACDADPAQPGAPKTMADGSGTKTDDADAQDVAFEILEVDLSAVDPSIEREAFASSEAVGDGLGIDPPRLEPGLEIAAYYNAAAAAIPEGFRVTASAVRASAEGDVYDIKLACEQADASPNTAVLVRFSRIERQLAADEISVGFDTSSLFTQDASGALVASCGPQIDPIYAEALDVHAEKIFIDPAAPAPTQYTPPPRITIGDAGGVSLNGTEFWRMWLEGQVEDIRNFSFSEGTELGRKCMQASAIRFEAVMAQAPAELADLLANSTWGGSFFNWNDDYSMGGQLESRAKLWAWRSHLIKWISQTAPDGTCYLPTLDMLEQLMPICIETAAANEGSVQGCDVQW